MSKSDFTRGAAGEKKFLKQFDFIHRNNEDENIAAPDFSFKNLLVDLKTEEYEMRNFSFEILKLKASGPKLELKSDYYPKIFELATIPITYKTFKTNNAVRSLSGGHHQLYLENCDLVIHTFTNTQKLLVVKISDLFFIEEFIRYILKEATTNTYKARVIVPTRSGFFDTICGIINIEAACAQFPQNLRVIEPTELRALLEYESLFKEKLEEIEQNYEEELENLYKSAA